ncbi:hypothetical protein CCR75_002877 [Bremia lactucae]|uniref:FYVE-type domain-containing protein n=1 Tax=Bremia lactucae TaxID=4779 RepID=A0A976FM74_BRELC|nr:hypothetical protein CCR75_002877 [Bremia lactucae]
MSNGVGFTVFQVPGAKTAKRSTSTKLGGGFVLSSVGSSLSVGEPYAASPHVGSSFDLSESSNVPPQRTSDATFASFQPPGGLQPVSTQSLRSTTALLMPSVGPMPPLSSSSLHSPASFNAKPSDEQVRGGAGWMRSGRIIRVKDSGDCFRFPLDADYLPTLNMSSDQFATLKSKCHNLAQLYINSTATWLDNPIQSPQYRNQNWKLQLEKKNIVIYRQKEMSDAPNVHRKMIVRAKLDTTLEEVEYAVNCCTTESQRAYMAHCYQDNFLDAAVVQVQEKATKDDPFQFLGVKWLAFQSPMDSIMSCRDTMVLEYSKTLLDAKRQKILVKVQQSVNMADYHGNEHNFGFLRVSGTWVWLFRGLGPSSGKVDVSMFGEDWFEGPRNPPSWFASRVLSTLYTVTIHHATAADAKFFVQHRRITDKAWVPNHERPACSICYKSFNLLRSRHHCRVCAEIMCGTCTYELGIQASHLPPNMLPDSGNSIIVSVEKFCLKCINKARQERRSAESQEMALSTEELSASLVVSTIVLREDEKRSKPFMTDLLEPQLQQDLSVASISSTSSVLEANATNGERSGISYTGWSTKVLGAINREKTSDGTKERALVTLTPAGNSESLDLVGSSTALQQESNDRRRQSNSSTNHRVMRNFSSVDSKGRKDLSAGDAIRLLEEHHDVQKNMTPLPTSFSKMEEQIAAQQALLRSMFIEGKKIMEQQIALNEQVHPPYVNQMSPMPSIVEGKSTLTLPPSSSASIEYIE